MESLTRLVTDSLARHGLDRPVDPRRLQWSRWFRCDSQHSLLVVPSKPGIFAIAEEVFGGADALVRPANNTGTAALDCRDNGPGLNAILGGAALQRCDPPTVMNAALAAEATPKRMLAVLQFSEDDDMAFVLDRMFTCINPMRSRLASGRCFIRFVVIADQEERRSICAALNQWLQSSAEKATGLPADFSSSLELTTDHVGRANVGRALSPANAGTANPTLTQPNSVSVPPQLASEAARDRHCPHPLPSGF
jgi:hypothetical protein